MNSLTFSDLPDDVVTTILRNADLQTCGRLACTDHRTAVLWSDGVPGRWDPRCAHCHGLRVSTADIVRGGECRFASIYHERYIGDNDSVRLYTHHMRTLYLDDDPERPFTVDYTNPGAGCCVRPMCMRHVAHCIDCGKVVLLSVWKSPEPNVDYEATVSCTVCWGRGHSGLWDPRCAHCYEQRMSTADNGS